jgi:hypothetical protein
MATHPVKSNENIYYRTDDARVSPAKDAGTLLVGVRNDSAANLTDTNGDYSPVAVDSAGRLQVVTSGGSAVTAADNMTNPTAPQSLSYLMAYDQPGGNWDRLQLAPAIAALKITSGAGSINNDGISSTANTLGDGGGTARPLATLAYLYNGVASGGSASIDKQRNNAEISVLSSAARTATTNHIDYINFNGRGVVYILNVTANPGGAETLSLKIQGKDITSSAYYDIVDAGVLFTAANGTKSLTAYPGVLSADAVAGSTHKSVVIPRTFRAVVTHSSTGSWTYSLSLCVMV